MKEKYIISDEITAHEKDKPNEEKVHKINLAELFKAKENEVKEDE